MLGLVLVLGRKSDLFIFENMSVPIFKIVRGVSLIVWLFTAQFLLNYYLAPGFSFDLTLRLIMMVKLFPAVCIAKVAKGGLSVLPKGQYEGVQVLH